MNEIVADVRSIALPAYTIGVATPYVRYRLLMPLAFGKSAASPSFLVWRNVLRSDRSESWRPAIQVLGALFFLHSYAWVIGNH